MGMDSKVERFCGEDLWILPVHISIHFMQTGGPLVGPVGQVDISPAIQVLQHELTVVQKF